MLIQAVDVLHLCSHKTLSMGKMNGSFTLRTRATEVTPLSLQLHEEKSGRGRRQSRSNTVMVTVDSSLNHTPLFRLVSVHL